MVLNCFCCFKDRRVSMILEYGLKILILSGLSNYLIMGICSYNSHNCYYFDPARSQFADGAGECTNQLSSHIKEVNAAVWVLFIYIYSFWW